MRLLPENVNLSGSWLRRVAVIVMMVLLSACAQFGPRALTIGRPMYNVAVQQTEAQQLLLNIVRQRYSDPVLFLDVTSISSGFSREASASVASKLFGAVTNSSTGSLDASVKESPYIFYSPNTGEKFVRQMLTPMDVRTVALILQAGWSIERVLLLTGESMNSLRNAPGNSGSVDTNKDYQDALSGLRDLQRDGNLMVGIDSSAEGPEGKLALMIAPGAIKSDAYLRVCGLLAVSCDGRPLRLRQAFGVGSDGETMALATRSLFSTLYFLAQSVEVPASDAAAGVTSADTIFDRNTGGWVDARSKLFHVRSSSTEPERASVKVFYRDAWFYIADNDMDSKVTFTLLSMLMTMQSGDTAKMSPLLTLPAQ